MTTRKSVLVLIFFVVVFVLVKTVHAQSIPLTPLLIPFQKFANDNPSVCSGRRGTPCIIPVDKSVLISARDVDVRSITVFGTLVIRPNPNVNPKLVVSTAFIVASGKQAILDITNASWQTSVIIYLRRDKEAYQDVDALAIPQKFLFTGGRVFGGANGARVFVSGVKLKKTFTLLAAPAYSDCGLRDCSNQPKGISTIFVEDDVSKDWRVGFELVIAPSDQQVGLWDSYRALRPGAFQAIIIDIKPATADKYCKITLKGSIPFYNYSAKNFPYTDVVGPADRTAFAMFQGAKKTGIQAEVFVLNRSIVITGDDFSAKFAPLPQPSWRNPAANAPAENNGWPLPPKLWSKYANSTAPVEGLHTIIAGDSCTPMDPCQSGGGWMKMQYARVEKAGQRGWVGRYPIHFHRMGFCPECEATGNVVYDTQQRGITIHSTGKATIQDNIIYNMKGAGIYLEEGTEIGNLIQRNVVVCGVGVKSFSRWDPTKNSWVVADPYNDETTAGACQRSSRQDFGDPSVILGGCRITGTDNEQADCVQQAGIWALSATNDILYNRVSNMYNAIYYQSTEFKDGRDGTDSKGRVCPIHSNWGKVRGNVCHSNERFGMYPDVNYPRNVKRSQATEGYVADLVTNPQCMSDLTDPVTWCSCRPVTIDGLDNAQNITYIEDELDWGNDFVGQYDLADVQYKGYLSIFNQKGIYWKGSKNMKDPSIPYIANSVFRWDLETDLPLAQWQGSTTLFFISSPGISGTMIFENVSLEGSPAQADWISNNDDIATGGLGAALGINQQCKGFTAGNAEGGICTPQILLRNVSFQGIKDNGFDSRNPATKQSGRPTWIKFGAESGNPFLGMVVSFDDSLCGGYQSPCKIKAVLPKFSTHLVGLPGNPCIKTLSPVNGELPMTEAGDWARRFHSGVICEVQTRRLTIWGQAQGSKVNAINLVLIPPGKQKQDGFKMTWLAFGRDYPNPCNGCCQGTECGRDEPRRFAEGYGAAVIPYEHFPSDEPWRLVREDDTPVDVSKITLVEFSDEVFDGVRLPGPDTVRITMNGIPCTLKSTDARLYMTSYGAMIRGNRGGGGSCVEQWLNSNPTGEGTPTSRGPTAFPSKRPTRFPTRFPSRKST